MAKKSKRKVSPTPVNTDALPQNILPVGERVTENRHIYISQPAYRAIHEFTRDKTKNESGGMLAGYTVEAFGRTNIVITGFIEARHSEATPTTLTFTHETWDYVHGELEKKYPGQKIMGWIHTHPNFGIFLSEYDKFIQENFFSSENQIAYVIDPIQETEGFYFWVGKSIERCAGFYLYDRTGVEITCAQKKSEKEEGEETPVSLTDKLWSALPVAIICILSVAVIFLLFSVGSLSSRITQLENDTNNNSTVIVNYFEQRIASLESELNAYINPPEAASPSPDTNPTTTEAPAATETPTVTNTPTATDTPTATEAPAGSPNP